MSKNVLPYDEACARAVHYVVQYGLSVIPIGENKKPCIKWKHFQERRPTFSEIASWPKEGFNLAVITGTISGGLVIVDCESREDAKWFWQNKGKTSVIVQTKRGIHFYFRSDTPVRNGQRCFERYDIRGEGGYALLPPSMHSEGRYEWKKELVDLRQLPEFDGSWRPEPTTPTYDEKRIRDGRAYISKIHSVQGNGGDKECFRAACALKDSGVSESEALLLMVEWNCSNTEPPWSHKELLHKVQCAYGENNA